MTVTLTRDWADWVLFGMQALSVLVTVGAVVLAFIELRQTRKERRLDFELTVLRELLLASTRVWIRPIRERIGEHNGLFYDEH